MHNGRFRSFADTNSHAARVFRYFPDMAERKTRWCTVKEAADEVGVDERTMRRWCNDQRVEAQLNPGGKTWQVKCYVDDGQPVQK